MKIEVERERYLELVSSLRAAEEKVHIFESALLEIVKRPPPYSEDEKDAYVRVVRALARRVLEENGHI